MAPCSELQSFLCNPFTLLCMETVDYFLSLNRNLILSMIKVWAIQAFFLDCKDVSGETFLINLHF